MSDMTRSQFVSGLHALADFLESHDNAPLPYGLYATVFCDETEARNARKGSYGWSKESDGSFFTYTQNLTPDHDGYAGVYYNVMVSKAEASTCHQVTVGTKHIPAHDEPIVKWVCGDDDTTIYSIPTNAEVATQLEGK